MMTKKQRWMKTVPAALVVLMLAMMAPAPADAIHDSTKYSQSVWFTWGETDIDVLVIPPSHGQLVNYEGTWPPLHLFGPDPIVDGAQTELSPFDNTYLDAIDESIRAWQDAWAAESSYLDNNVNLNVHLLGRDDPTTPSAASAISNPEILITALEETNAYLGVSIINPVIKWADCIISNTKTFLFSLTYNDMFNLNAHEFGHCLGSEHIHDDDPRSDLMDSTYRFPVGDQENRKKCISNLNVQVVEQAFMGNDVTVEINRSGAGAYDGIPRTGDDGDACVD